ncbi:MAG: hypothetical protein VCD50_07535 [Alphaproteobacteria bacterium]|jgi:hypothetical protein
MQPPFEEFQYFLLGVLVGVIDGAVSAPIPGLESSVEFLEP